MRMEKIFAVVGEDARQQAAGKYLRKQGFGVVGAEEVYSADYILLPMPLEPEKTGLARLLRAAKPGAVAFGGRVSPQVQAAGAAAGVPIEDYFLRPELAELNAVPTAEGCLALLMAHRDRTLWGSRVLVAGYGRIGRALGLRLKALGADVTVAARRAGQRGQAMADGLEAADTAELARAVSLADCCVNTVPAKLFTAEVLEKMGRETLLVDLASRPGGVDDEAARRLGVKLIHGLSLPARHAPETAGELVGSTVRAMLRGREGGMA